MKNRVRFTYYVVGGDRMTWVGEVSDDVLATIKEMFDELDGAWGND